jgi:hypothetical protein
MPYIRNAADPALRHANWCAVWAWLIFRGIRAAALREDVYQLSDELHGQYERSSLEAWEREELARRATRWHEMCLEGDILEAAMRRAYHDYHAYPRTTLVACMRILPTYLAWHRLVNVADTDCCSGVPDAERLITTTTTTTPSRVFSRCQRKTRASPYYTGAIGLRGENHSRRRCRPCALSVPHIQGETSATRRTEGGETDDDFIDK